MDLIQAYRDQERIRARAVAREIALAVVGGVIVFGGFVALCLTVGG